MAGEEDLETPLTVLETVVLAFERLPYVTERTVNDTDTFRYARLSRSAPDLLNLRSIFCKISENSVAT